MTDNTKHLNQVELSRRLGVACRTLERWRWQGLGPKFIKVGGRVKYRLVDVESYEQSRLCQSTSDTNYPATLASVEASGRIVRRV
jgi:DNA-binding transcriptional MerR regulator